MRRIAVAALILIAPLALGGCRKKSAVRPVPASPAPPAPDYFEQGEALFDSGRYQEAAEAYQKYLDISPAGLNQDRALLRLALAYSSQGTGSENSEKTIHLLRRLVETFPNSPLRPHADLILALHSEIVMLKASAADSELQITRLTNRMEKLRGEIVRERQTEIDRLRADLKDKDERIRRLSSDLEKLTTELEKLKKIDMERRPSRPEN